ncbi:MAG: hypothetical protein ABI972_04645 [Acidobacteriota bacterium]
MPRDASILGEPSAKPFLKDLYDLALQKSSPNDWLLYSNVDCAIAEDFYDDLLSRRATVVEYQRQDVDGDPKTLAELFSNSRTVYSVGLDAMAIRAGFYAEVREWLPDFVVGEPHWDTIYTGIFRKLLPVQRDSVRLFHPRHERMWDLGHPTAAGQHNHELFVDCLSHGFTDKSMITDTIDQTDTAVIIAVFGDDPARLNANIAGIREQLRQDLYADVFLVELLPGDATTCYPPDVLSRVHHVPVHGDASCLELFQKEALLNYGWRAALKHAPYQYFILVDADVYSPQPDWFRRIRERLQHDPSSAVHGYRTVRDSIDTNLHYSSLGAAFVLGEQTGLPLNPGICWGLHRTLLEAGDGLNPMCIDCGGDSAFVAEFLNTPQTKYDPWLYQWDWYREIERQLPFHAGLDCVAADLVHVHHGYLKERHYDGFRYAMNSLPPLKEFIRLNGHGLLEWIDPECGERQVLKHRHSMGSREAVDELLARLAYSPHVRPIKVEHKGAPERPRFEPIGLTRHHLPGPHLIHKAASRAGLKIFDPDEVFREDFPFSWCDGVEKPEDSTFIPILDLEDSAVLMLDGKPDAQYVVAALPLQPTWLDYDASAFQRLSFAIRVSANVPRDLRVTITSTSPDGVENESAPVYPRDAGMQPDVWSPISIPLDKFSGPGIDVGSIRLIKFSGTGSFRLELAKIYLERAT